MSSDDIEFRCPSCGTTFRVNAPMRRTLLDDGCVRCGADVPATAFSPRP